MNKLFLDWRSKLRAAPETPAKSATGRYWLDRAGHRAIDANLAR